MKKYPKIVQCDARGQIVIPKEIRNELGVEEGTGFFMYSITDEGILLKKIPEDELGRNETMLKELKDKSDKIRMNTKNIDKSVDKYKRTKKGGLDLV